MKIIEFRNELQKSKTPVVVEFWAGWCRPCKAMAPGLKTVSQEMTGRVRLWKINADENPDILRELKVMGIPTMIGYQSGREIARRTGALGVDGIRTFFEAVEKGETPKKTLTSFDRWMRLLVAAVLIFLGSYNGWQVWLIVVGAVVLFSAVYDRCPIYRAVTAKLRELWRG